MLCIGWSPACLRVENKTRPFASDCRRRRCSAASARRAAPLALAPETLPKSSALAYFYTASNKTDKKMRAPLRCLGGGSNSYMISYDQYYHHIISLRRQSPTTQPGKAQSTQTHHKKGETCDPKGRG